MVFPVENGKIALVRTLMVVTYYIKLFCTRADRHKVILIPLLLLAAETIIWIFIFINKFEHSMIWLYICVFITHFPLLENIFNEKLFSIFPLITIKNIMAQFRNISRKTIVLESLFDKSACLKACNFIKKRLQHRYFPVNITKFLRAPILNNICERLLLECTSTCH